LRELCHTGRMPDAAIIEGLERKFNLLVGDLDERGRRRWVASEAMALGYGGITAVALATGLSDRTIRNGIQELQSNDPLPSGRQRRQGGARLWSIINKTWSKRSTALSA